MKQIIWNITKVGVILFVLSANPNKTYSQACCSGGVPIGGNFGLGTADRNSFQILFTYDYNAINTLVNISSVLNDDVRKRTTHSSILELNYGISERLSFTALFPYIRQERKIQGYGGATDFTSTQGFGDIMFLIKYRILNPLNQPDWSWVIGSGMKLPSGKTDFKNNLGLTLVADMQPGSGSVDGLFWMFAQKSNFLTSNLSLLSISTVKLSGSNNKYNQTESYQFGNEFQMNLGLNYRFFKKWPLDVFAFFRYRTQSVDLINGFTFPGSGGDWLYAIPGISIDFSSALSVRLSGDIPLYRKLKGTQLTTSYKLTAAIYYRIPSKPKVIIQNLKL